MKAYQEDIKIHSTPKQISLININILKSKISGKLHDQEEQLFSSFFDSIETNASLGNLEEENFHSEDEENKTNNWISHYFKKSSLMVSKTKEIDNKIESLYTIPDLLKEVRKIDSKNKLRHFFKGLKSNFDFARKVPTQYGNWSYRSIIYDYLEKLALMEEDQIQNWIQLIYLSDNKIYSVRHQKKEIKNGLKILDFISNLKREEQKEKLDILIDSINNSKTGVDLSYIWILKTQMKQFLKNYSDFEIQENISLIYLIKEKYHSLKEFIEAEITTLHCEISPLMYFVIATLLRISIKIIEIDIDKSKVLSSYENPREYLAANRSKEIYVNDNLNFHFNSIWILLVHHTKRSSSGKKRLKTQQWILYPKNSIFECSKCNQIENFMYNENILTLHCEHSFHRLCFKELIENECRKCPRCSTNFTKADYFLLDMVNDMEMRRFSEKYCSSCWNSEIKYLYLECGHFCCFLCAKNNLISINSAHIKLGCKFCGCHKEITFIKTLNGCKHNAAKLKKKIEIETNGNIYQITKEKGEYLFDNPKCSCGHYINDFDLELLFSYDILEMRKPKCRICQKCFPVAHGHSLFVQCPHTFLCNNHIVEFLKRKKFSELPNKCPFCSRYLNKEFFSVPITVKGLRRFINSKFDKKLSQCHGDIIIKADNAKYCTACNQLITME